MRLLAIDTSTWWGSAALLESEGGTTTTVAEIGTLVGDSHAARSLPAVEALLAVAGWSKTTLDAFAAVRGPGSFTGIRVGLGLARGLGLAAGRPCVGVTTLEAMAEAWGPADADRIPLIDAGRGETYGARYDPRESPPRQLVTPWVGDPARAVEGAGVVVVFGIGLDGHAARLREAGYSGAIGRAPGGIAAAAGRIAATRLVTAPPGDLDFTPLYVRPSDAEIKFR